MLKINYTKEMFFTPKGSIRLILMILGVLVGLAIPKIYLTNNIYYVSKDINRLYSHYMSLKEENRILIQQLEDAKFKNQIADALIMQELESESLEE